MTTKSIRKVKLETDGVVVVSSPLTRKILDNIKTVKPNFSDISKDTGIPITTVWDNWNKLYNHNDIEITIRIIEKKSKGSK